MEDTSLLGRPECPERPRVAEDFVAWYEPSSMAGRLQPKAVAAIEPLA